MAHPAFSAGWAGLGLIGAALPLRRRRSWAESTRNSHLLMCLVMVTMVLPGAPWWFPVGGLVLLFATGARTLTVDGKSPDAVPCLIDALAMGLMVLVAVVTGQGHPGSGGHSSAGFGLLSVQIAVVWMCSAYWSRRPRTALSTRSDPTVIGRPLAAVALPIVGTTLMAVAMSAMMTA